jgi:hypothetical protein
VAASRALADPADGTGTPLTYARARRTVRVAISKWRAQVMSQDLTSHYESGPMTKRKHPRRVPAFEYLEGRRLLSVSVGEVARTQALRAASRYLLNGTLTDEGSLSHHVQLPGGSYDFFSTTDLFGRLKSPGQVGAPGAIKYVEPQVAVFGDPSLPSFPEPVHIIPQGNAPNLGGATITLDQVKKSGKHLLPIQSGGMLVLSVSSSASSTYRFTVSSATGKFAAAAGGNGTVSFVVPKNPRVLPYLRLRSD